MAASKTVQAAGFAVAGMAGMGFIDNFVKVIAEDIGLWQFHAARSAMVLAVFVPAALWLGWDIHPRKLWAVALRSFLVATAMILYFGALASLPIAQVGAGLFTAPIFVLVLSATLLRRRIGPWRIGAVGLGFLGVILLLRPDAAAFSWFSLVPVLAGFFYALGALCTKTLCEGEGTTALLAGFFTVLGLWGLGGTIVLSGGETSIAQHGFFGAGWQDWTVRALFWTVAQGAISVIAIGCLTRAYQIAEASHVAVFEYTFLIFAGFWSYVLWSELPDAIGLMGIALIVVAGVTIVIRGEGEAAPA